MQDGGSEAEIVAAILHDTMEDKHIPAAEIKGRLGGAIGKRVADIVLGCSDGIDEYGNYIDSRGLPVAERGPSTWLDRKRAYLSHLKNDADTSILRVSAADKLDNARDVVADLHDCGARALREFNAPPADQLWWYSSLASVFHERLATSTLTKRLVTTVSEMTRLVDVVASTHEWENRQREKRHSE